MRVKSVKPPAAYSKHLGLQVLLEVGDGADDRVGDQMRQMRGDRQHPVVVLGRHRLDHACRPRSHSARDLRDRVRIGVLERRQDAAAARGTASAKAASGPECSVPATGWPATNSARARQMRDARRGRPAP